MRINGLIPISLVTLLSLGLCKGPNRKTNYFVPGNYVGTNKEDEEDIYYLRVESITEEAYKSFNGENVVEDVVNGGYYYLDLYQLDDFNNKIVTTFMNLKDSTKVKARPVIYKDDNKHWVWPYYHQSSDEKPNYMVIIKDSIVENIERTIFFDEDKNHEN